jgi:ATP-dependent Clp protease ATP-binding subunit ClpC
VPSFRIPVLLWEDHEGAVTAALADFDEPVAAVGDNPRDALLQLKTYVRKRLEERGECQGDNLLEPRLVEAKVRIRAGYRTGNVNHPCPELVTLNVTAVAGRRRDGVLVCTLPTFALRFDYHGDDSLSDLILHQVQMVLQRLTPLEVSRFLPPVRFWLQDFTVRTPNASPNATVRPLATLLAHAQPLTGKETFPGLKLALERGQEIEELTRRLRHEPANILLVGETGCGKTRRPGRRRKIRPALLHRSASG